MIPLIASLVWLCLSSGAIGTLHSHLNLGSSYLSYPEKVYDGLSSHSTDLSDLLSGYNGYYKSPLSYPSYSPSLYNGYHSELRTQPKGGIRVIPAPHQLELLRDLPVYGKARIVGHLPTLHQSPVRYHSGLLNSHHLNALHVLKKVPAVQHLPLIQSLPVVSRTRVKLVRPAIKLHQQRDYHNEHEITGSVLPLKNVAVEHNEGILIDNHDDINTHHGKVILKHAPRVVSAKLLDDHHGHIISGLNIGHGHIGHSHIGHGHVRHALPIVTSLRGLHVRGGFPLHSISGSISGLSHSSLLHGRPLYTQAVLLDDIHDSGIHSKGIEFLHGGPLAQIVDDDDIEDEIDDVDGAVAEKPQIVEEVENQEQKPQVDDYEKKSIDDKQEKYDDESAEKDKDGSYQKEEKQYQSKDTYEKPAEKYPAKTDVEYSPPKTNYDIPKYEDKKAGYGSQQDSGAGKYGQKSYGSDAPTKTNTKVYITPPKVSADAYQPPKTYDTKPLTTYNRPQPQPASYPKQTAQQQGAYGTYTNPRGRSKQYRKSGGDVSNYEYEILHSKSGGHASLNINSGVRVNDYHQTPVQKYTERPRSYSQDNEYKSAPTTSPYETRNTYQSSGSPYQSSSGSNYGKLSQTHITQETDSRNYGKIEQRDEEYDAGSSSRSYSSSIGQSS